MPLYMLRFGYKPETWAELIRRPANREEALGRILEEAGCTLHGLWYALGDADGFTLVEAPDNTTAAAVALAIVSSGAFRKLETTAVMTQEELLEALHVASGVYYVPPIDTSSRKA
jgi:uncharacterized protein with GYD domain